MSFLHFGGSWWLRSKTDPRWNCNGEAGDVNGFSMSSAATKKIEELKKTLGEPPADLEYGCMKD